MACAPRIDRASSRVIGCPARWRRASSTASVFVRRPPPTVPNFQFWRRSPTRGVLPRPRRAAATRALPSRGAITACDIRVSALGHGHDPYVIAADSSSGRIGGGDSRSSCRVRCAARKSPGQLRARMPGSRRTISTSPSCCKVCWGRLTTVSRGLPLAGPGQGALARSESGTCARSRGSQFARDPRPARARGQRGWAAGCGLAWPGILEACTACMRPRAAWRACSAWPRPGTAG